MKKQSLIIIVSLLLLIPAVFITISDRNSTIGRSAKYFTVNDTSQIQVIKIEGIDTLVLQRSGKEWTLNDTMSANQNAVNNFLFVFSRLSISGIQDKMPVKAPPHHITVSFKEDKKIKTFRYHKINNIDMLQREGKTALFQVEVSGFPKIEISDVVKDNQREWRDRMLFSLKPEDIERVRVHYPSKIEEDFMILNRGDSLFLLNYAGDIVYPPATTNNARLQMYLSYFSNIFFEDFLPEKHSADSVLNTDIYFQMEIGEKTGNIIRLQIWPVYQNAILNRNFIYLRKNNEKEILLGRHVLTDLWGKEKKYFVSN